MYFVERFPTIGNTHLIILEFSHNTMHGINNSVKFANCLSQKLDHIIIIIIIA